MIIINKQPKMGFTPNKAVSISNSSAIKRVFCTAFIVVNIVLSTNFTLAAQYLMDLPEEIRVKKISTNLECLNSKLKVWKRRKISREQRNLLEAIREHHPIREHDPKQFVKNFDNLSERLKDKDDVIVYPGNKRLGHRPYTSLDIDIIKKLYFKDNISQQETLDLDLLSYLSEEISTEKDLYMKAQSCCNLIQMVEQAASQGSVSALTMYGRMNYMGLFGMDKNIHRGIAFLRLAAGWHGELAQDYLCEKNLRRYQFTQETLKSVFGDHLGAEYEQMRREAIEGDKESAKDLRKKMYRNHKAKQVKKVAKAVAAGAAIVIPLLAL